MEKGLANRNRRYIVEGSNPPDVLEKGKTFSNLVETNPVVTVKKSASPNVTKVLIVVIVIVGIAVVGGVIAMTVELSKKDEERDKTTDQTPHTSARVLTSTTLGPVATTSSTTPEPGRGVWSAWGDWTQCTATCNSGIHKRYRRCNGQDSTECVGDFIETEICEENVCPVYAKWASWESWGSCDTTCGGGTQSRTRICSKTDSVDFECVGRNSQDKICSNWECPDCSRKCTVGTLNTDCDTCTCAGTVLTGRVRAVSTGNPISNAAFYTSTAPTKLLTQSNSTGYFILDNVCTETELIVTRDGFVDKNVNISSDFIEIELTKLVLPYLTETPQTKFRLSGEDVTLCCEAVANPSIDYYEWLKDDILLDETLFQDGNMLILSDLTIADSGRYQCRANSPAGAIMSPTASLSVKTISDDFCSDALQQKTVVLPDDCVQSGTNTATYEIGECLSKSCRGNTTTNTESCREDISTCCKTGEADLETVQCSGYELELVIVRSCSCALCLSNSLTISGTALGLEDGSPLKYGEIFVNSVFKGYTSNSGEFSFITSKLSQKLTINLQDRYLRQFLPAIKVIRISDEMSGVLRIEIRMTKAVEPIDIDSTTENTLVAGSAGSTTPVVQITIPANAFYYHNGTQYNGTVAASLTFLDPTNTTVIDNIPGVFQFVDGEGQTGNLASLGVFNLYFEDASHNPLVLDEVLDLYIPLSIGENVTDKNIRLWKMNTETGNWEYITAGTGTRRRKRQDTAFWIGEIDWSTVSDQEWFNYDYVYYLTERPCFFKIRVYKDAALTSSSSSSFWGFNVDYHFFKDSTLTTVSDYIYNPEQDCVIGLCDGDNTYLTVRTNGRNGYQGLFAAAPEVGTGDRYEITDENKVLKIEMSASEDGPFYENELQCEVSNSKSFHLRYHFGETTEVFTFNKIYSAILKNGYLKNKYLSQRTWYPNRNRYSVCFMKVRILFAERFYLAYNEVIKLRVTSYGGTNQNIKGFILGIREYIIAHPENTTLCVEYKCSGIMDQEFDSEFDYTRVVLKLKFPNDNIDCAIEQEAEFVSHEPLSFNSAQLGRTNGTYDVYLPAVYIPEIGIYSATSDKFDIASATNTAEGECRSGQPQILDEDNPDIGVSVSFVCENTCTYYDYLDWFYNCT